MPRLLSRFRESLYSILRPRGHRQSSTASTTIVASTQPAPESAPAPSLTQRSSFPAFPTWPPPPPRKLLAEAEQYRMIIYYRRQRWPEGENDNSLYALYRLYEELVLNNLADLRNEIEYFWNRHQWAVMDIPDPKDDNPERYAVLAGIPYLLVEAFNRNIGRGMPRDSPTVIADDELDELNAREKIFEQVPIWTSQVPPLSTTLSIPGGRGVVLELDDDDTSSAFRVKNVSIPQPHIHFI